MFVFKRQENTFIELESGDYYISIYCNDAQSLAFAIRAKSVPLLRVGSTVPSSQNRDIQYARLSSPTQYVKVHIDVLDDFNRIPIGEVGLGALPSQSSSSDLSSPFLVDQLRVYLRFCSFLGRNSLATFESDILSRVFLYECKS